MACHILLPRPILHPFGLLVVTLLAFPTVIGMLGLSFTEFSLPMAFLIVCPAYLVCYMADAVICACVWVQLSHGLALPLLDEPLFVPKFLGFPFFWCTGGGIWLVHDCITLRIMYITISWRVLQHSAQYRTLPMMLSDPVLSSSMAVWAVPSQGLGGHTLGIVTFQTPLDLPCTWIQPLWHHGISGLWGQQVIHVSTSGCHVGQPHIFAYWFLNQVIVWTIQWMLSSPDAGVVVFSELFIPLISTFWIQFKMESRAWQ